MSARQAMSLDFDPVKKPTAQADFNYSITPATIAITDTGKGRRSVTNDIEAVLRKTSTGIRDQSPGSRSVIATRTGSGTVFGRTVNIRRSLRWGRRMRRRRGRGGRKASEYVFFILRDIGDPFIADLCRSLWNVWG